MPTTSCSDSAHRLEPQRSSTSANPAVTERFTRPPAPGSQSIQAERSSISASPLQNRSDARRIARHRTRDPGSVQQVRSGTTAVVLGSFCARGWSWCRLSCVDVGGPPVVGCRSRRSRCLAVRRWMDATRSAWCGVDHGYWCSRRMRPGLSTLAEISDPDEVNLLVDLCRLPAGRCGGGPGRVVTGRSAITLGIRSATESVHGGVRSCLGR